jgi:hypothetical protein
MGKTEVSQTEYRACRSSIFARATAISRAAHGVLSRNYFLTANELPIDDDPDQGGIAPRANKNIRRSSLVVYSNRFGQPLRIDSLCIIQGDVGGMMQQHFLMGARLKRVTNTNYPTMHNARNGSKTSEVLPSIQDEYLNRVNPIRVYPCRAPVHQARHSLFDYIFHTRDLKEERQQTLADVDKASFRGFFWAALVFAGVGFFTDAYNVSLLVVTYQLRMFS